MLKKISRPAAIHTARALLVLSLSLVVIDLIARPTATQIIQQLEILDVIALSGLVVAFAVSPLVLLDTKDTNSDSILERVPVYLGFTVGLLAAAIAWHNTQQPAAAVLFSGLLATIGWMSTQRNARKASKKQHTLNILMSTRTNDILEYHIANVANRFHFGVRISKREVEKLIEERRSWDYFCREDADAAATQGPRIVHRIPRYPVIESILYIANYYEFICVGVLTGDLDEQMIKRSQRSQLCAFYRKAIHVMNHFQKVDALGAPSGTAFLSFREVFEKWSTLTERKLD
jgi:hypothetical protein